ncbi:DUF6538 domain-containing protein [Sphingobium nicotianae]|uniref:DUF6538 domain-containing protein n=1 Tax=Sphingobium nicotianae TaxID=2782607 RepID=A0A9X1DCH6_9SPHN|nr:DUF6538 domain-containing protein [Sphingobium nicotianae]MBT2187466.1 hypothetical protein [Sphingobium nicotianae]
MARQTYLLRKSGRYHFRRRFSPDCATSKPISIALGTSDPAEARRVANRLAVKWDAMMEHQGRIEPGTLSAEQQRMLFRRGLEEELVHATRHVTAFNRPNIDEESYAKVAATALAIVGSVPHDAAAITVEMAEAKIDATWTDAERKLLGRILSFGPYTPNYVSRSWTMEMLRAIGAPVNEGTLTEGRETIFRGMIEAQKRSALADHPIFAGCDVPALHLMDDMLVGQARAMPMDISAGSTGPIANPSVNAAQSNDESYYVKQTEIRFSEQIDSLLAAVTLRRGYKPDNGQRLAILQRFAWITGDKVMSDYGPSDRIDYVNAMMAIPNTVRRFGVLGKEGLMKLPFDPTVLPLKTPETERSLRTLNRDLTILAAAEEILHETHWRPKYNGSRVVNFLASWAKVEEDDPMDPKRMPWTPEHLGAMYSLAAWTGGGGSGERLKPSEKPRIYQDAAYWLPLFGTYMGVAREEGAGFEVADFNFECDVPFVLVQANMTRSKDGKTKGGLKRKARRRVMPLHPELLRLGLKRYVEAIAEEGHTMIFPELYLAEAKFASSKESAEPRLGREAFGGRRFYAISWVFIMDATHALMPLPATSDGKKADFHSQRTYNNSVLASPEVSDSIIAKHMGHAQKGTGSRRYLRRALALGELRELQERLQLMNDHMPIVTAGVPFAKELNLLPLNQRSRVGSAPGRNAKHRFCA